MMKNISIFWMLFIALFACEQTAWAQFSDGDGTRTNPYQISSVEDWDKLSNAVKDGSTYSDKYFKLTDNISVTTMVGTSTYKFSGTFDGNGHTLCFNKDATEQYIAPFRFINNAIIENLKVSGTVTSSNKYAGGVVAHATGSNTITNCLNSTSINATIDGNGSHGGILGQLGGENSSVTISGCLFNGEMLGNNTDYWCGMIGYYGSNSVTISDCLFKPQQVNIKSSNYNFTICRPGPTVRNGFYNSEAAKMHEKQGKLLYSIIPAPHVTVQLIGLLSEYNVSGITIYENSGHGLKVGDELYAASDDVLELDLGVEPGYTATRFYANGYQLYASGVYSGCYAMTMPASDITITANQQIADLEGDGSEENPYLIYNIYQLAFLSDYVTNETIRTYNDKFFKLMADMTIPGRSGELMVRYRATINMNRKVITTEDPESSIFHVVGPEELSYTPSLTLTNGGTLQGFDGISSADGGAIYNEGILNLQDVTIQNCNAANGAVYNAGTMTMSGGTITDCSATENGGGVYNIGSLTMTGGTITGCSATESGGGVYNDGQMMMSGNPKVYSNTGGNVSLSTGNLINVNEAFTSDANIYVSRDDGDLNSFTSGYSTYNSSTAPASVFHSENSMQLTALNEGEVYFCYWFGSGTESDPFQIPSTERWNVLAANVNTGNNYNGMFFKLMNDITVNTMVGDNLTRFQGTFDGGDFTLTLQFGNSDNYSDLMYTAPFRYTQNATFKNLTVDGNIYAGAKYAGALVGNSLDNCTFINCHVCVTITSSVVGEGGHGGFLGYAYGNQLFELHPNFTNCWFDGKLLGPQTYNCGGFIGYLPSNTTSFYNCLFAPSELTVGTQKSGTFSPNGVYSEAISQSYYTTPFGNNHGIRVYNSIPDGEISSLVTAVNQQTYYTPVVINGLRKGYPLSEDMTALAYSLRTIDWIELKLDEDYTQEIRDCNNEVATSFAQKGDYTLTITACQDSPCFGSKTIPFYIYSNWPGEGLGTEDDPFVIASVSDLNKLMELIQTYTNPESELSGEYQFKGNFFLQTADIDYSEQPFDEQGCNYYTYGGYNTFLGNYDGNGHTISGIVSKQKSGDAFGLFGYVREGSIKNLTVTNSTFTSDQSMSYNNFTGGIAGHLGDGALIDNCHVTNSVYILAGDRAEYHGGIVGHLSQGALVSNCTSAAHVCLVEGVTPQYGMSYFGGVVGFNHDGEVRNCLYLGNDVVAYDFYGAIAGTNFYIGQNWREQYSTMNHNFYHGGTLPGIGYTTGPADVPEACRAICMDELPSGVTEDDYIAYGGKYYVRAGMLLDDDSNAELLAQNQEEGVTTYTLTGRTLWKDGGWNTLCLPFDVTIDDAADLKGAEARELESASFDKENGELCLNFSEPVVTIEAGKPYIVKFPTDMLYSQYSRDRYYDANAFDGNPSSVATITMDNHTWPVIFAASGAFNMTGYKLYAPDYDSFLPTKWELRAKLNDGDQWTVIDSRDETVNPSDAMPRESGAAKEYTLAPDKQGLYRYFNLFVTDVVYDAVGLMKLGEIELVGDFENQQIYNPTFTDVTLTVTEPTPIDCGPVTFQGTYTSTTFTEANHSILFLSADNTLNYPLEGASIGAFRAFFQLNGITAGDTNNSTSISSFRLNFSDEILTGIFPILSPQGEKNHAQVGDTEDVLYDLSGRRVHHATKGIYIRNGRKIIIK